MGDGGVNNAVADAGPLIHLTEIGCLPLLDIFERLHVPDAVWSETVGQNRISQDELLEGRTVERHSLAGPDLVRFIQKNGLESLQSGEQECLRLSKQIDVPVVLTDDLSVREASKRLNLTPVGSLGIVVRAHRQGHISIEDAERHIVDLNDVSSLFATRAIVELAIEQLSGSV